MAASSSCLAAQCKYDVFVSFRGEDTRDNFTSHLVAALCRKKIKTFIDEQLDRGDEISPALLDAIERSKISVIIFSENYASSKWCLDELVKILECKNKNAQMVVPVFYHVDPSDVRKQTGSFGDAFVKHEKQFKGIPEKVQKWRVVLTEASNLSGWDSMNIRPEAKLVDEIIEDILKKLKDKSFSSDFEGLVGIYSRIEQIKSLLCVGLPDFQIIGIWGMGGIGKTTIAGAIFNQISNDFEGRCFMANVREESERGGLVYLRERLYSEILEETLKIRTPSVPKCIKERLQQMKVFVVLDDVNKPEQLDYLAGGLDRFGLGSRVVVTSRDRQVFDKCTVDKIYEVEGLNQNEALEHFSNYAFRQNICPKDFLVLSERIVFYANGNPLALKVLGSFLQRKCKLQWENALKNLTRISDPDIYDMLKISYNELKQEEKSIFLDIACFFKGDDKDFMTRIQDDPESVHYGLNVLVDKSLVTLSCNNKLQIHDLLQEFGREIVRQQSVKEPGKRSRLWYYEDVYQVLKKNKNELFTNLMNFCTFFVVSFFLFAYKGTESIEGMFLDVSQIEDLHLTSRAFVKMPNLRLLKFYVPGQITGSDMCTKVHLQQGLQYLPDELRYFHWYGYPLKALPFDFSPENLIELNLPHSKVEQIWEGKKEAFKLKFIDLQYSQYLTTIPHPSETPNLERINLWNCTNLPYIPSYIQHFNNLVMLCLSHCESLRCFPQNIHFRTLIEIDFSYCINLTEFPEISGNVIELDLKGTAIEEIPSSIECLTKLEELDLAYCRRLKSLPSSICKLKSLHLLCLYNCSNFEIFPEILEKMECLEYIDLESTAVKELPSSVEQLKGLRELILEDCSELSKLPENLGNLKSLKRLFAKRSAISKLPSSIAYLDEVIELSFHGCRGLVLPPILSGLSSLTKLDLSDCDVMEIPQDIGRASSLEILDISGNDFDSLPASIKQLSRLRELYLSNCSMLQSLPELPLRVKLLDASNCKQLQSLPELPSCLEELPISILEMTSKHSLGSTQFKILADPCMELTFTDCLKLNEKGNNILADLRLIILHMAIASLRLFSEKEFKKPHGISIFLPGSGIPDWFSNQGSGSSITIQLSQHCCSTNLIGFSVCAVIEYEDDFPNGGGYFNVGCSYCFEITALSETKHDDFWYLGNQVSTCSDHIYIGFRPCINFGLPDGISVSFHFFTYNLFTNNENGHKVNSWARSRQGCKCRKYIVDPSVVRKQTGSFGMKNTLKKMTQKHCCQNLIGFAICAVLVSFNSKWNGFDVDFGYSFEMRTLSGRKHARHCCFKIFWDGRQMTKSDHVVIDLVPAGMLGFLMIATT
ncbi:Disease resistance-like protein DSC1 [Citrus sinensis]|uniref:Disease resistance-like protein DSC1 n=1 Tax=Citrus sinensis TaxID=2711 RepID=A0ACB8MC39_CITSI|nr:Disease resistance-like protein DSC1 [Citrus sinensis]